MSPNTQNVKGAIRTFKGLPRLDESNSGQKKHIHRISTNAFQKSRHTAYYSEALGADDRYHIDSDTTNCHNYYVLLLDAFKWRVTGTTAIVSRCFLSSCTFPLKRHIKQGNLRNNVNRINGRFGCDPFTRRVSCPIIPCW